MAASLGPGAGKIPMNKKPVHTLAALAVALFGSVAFAQNVPLRGIGLLALDAGDARGANPAGGRNALVELPDDGGGGSIGARAVRGSGDAGGGARIRPNPSPDALPAPAIVAPGDPGLPAAPTPKRPSYRWQSLVPGAIK